jgi:hypothetical protein
MLLDDLRTRLFQLDISIAQQERLLQELKEQRAAVQHQLNLFVYPTVLTLPHEITAEIFMWCSNDSQPDLSQAPLLLLRVCKAWRTLALSVPALWARLDQIECHTMLGPEKTENLITTWFSRAGALPLSLDITYDGYWEPETPHIHSLIRRHASRLQFLRVFLEDDYLPDLADIRPFPLLRDLTLGSIDRTPTQTPVSVFSGAPLLRHLTIEFLVPSSLLMPWAQLTKFTATLVALQECLMILRLATALQEFCRSDGSPEDEEPDMELPLPVCHSSLTSLMVDTSNYEHNMLDFLTLPGLQTFQFGGKFGSWRSDFDTVVPQFLSRISSTLRTFIVGMHIPLASPIPIQWFHIISHITNLELFYPRNSSEAVRSLDRCIAPDFLPMLQDLTFSECHSEELDADLLDALKSRSIVDTQATIVHARLETFRLIWSTYSRLPPARLSHAQVAHQRVLMSEGMHVHVGTRDHNSLY